MTGTDRLRAIVHAYVDDISSPTALQAVCIVARRAWQNENPTPHPRDQQKEDRAHD